jgi:transposase
MREEQLTLSGKELKRAQVLTRVLAGEWTEQEAAEVLGLSERQVRRLQTAYAEEGVQALVHGNRGRLPTHTLPASVRARVVELAQGKYAGFNQQHLTEKLNTVEGLTVSRTTVRRLLATVGLRSPRPRRAPQHRRRRERRPQAGMLLQADGSRHLWLGPAGPYLTLIGGIDDATNEVPWALFREQEDAHGYMEWLRHVVATQGIPLALYVDRHGIFHRAPKERWTLDEELAGGPLPTQFGRVLAELQITCLPAQSPQAKGRVERLWGTFQDRLVSELHLAGATTLAEANRVLWDWLPQFNARFTLAATQPGSAYRAVPLGYDPERVFCFKYTRVVAPDNTIQFGGHALQLLADPVRSSYAKTRVEVHERLDGSVAVYYHDRCLAVTPAPLQAPTLRARSGPRVPPPVPDVPPPVALPPAAAPAAPPRKPAPDHPWRRSPAKQKNGQTA